MKDNQDHSSGAIGFAIVAAIVLALVYTVLIAGPVKADHNGFNGYADTRLAVEGVYSAMGDLPPDGSNYWPDVAVLTDEGLAILDEHPPAECYAGYWMHEHLALEMVLRFLDPATPEAAAPAALDLAASLRANAPPGTC